MRYKKDIYSFILKEISVNNGYKNRIIISGFLLLAFFITSCRSVKNTPKYADGVSSHAAQNPIKSDSTYQTLDSLIVKDSLRIFKESSNQRLVTKTNKKNKTERIKSRISICNICEGVKMAKKAKEIITPPENRGCFAPFLMIIWAIMLPVLLIIAMILYLIAVLTIILYVLFLALILFSLFFLLFLLLGLISPLTIILSIVCSVLFSMLLYKLICSWCK